MRSVALTPATARIHARPLSWHEGSLDHRHVPSERWHLPAGYERELLTRAAAAHLDRSAALRQRSRWEDGIRIHDRREAPDVIRMRGGWLVDGAEFHGDGAEYPDDTAHDPTRPPGTLRWRPCGPILSVR